MTVRIEHINTCEWCDSLMGLEESKDNYLCYECRKYGCKKQATAAKYIKAFQYDKDVEEHALEKWVTTNCSTCVDYRSCYNTGVVSSLKNKFTTIISRHRRIGRKKK